MVIPSGMHVHSDWTVHKKKLMTKQEKELRDAEKMEKKEKRRIEEKKLNSLSHILGSFSHTSSYMSNLISSTAFSKFSVASCSIYCLA